MDGFHLCKLTWLTFSFCSFRDVSWGTPYNCLQPLMLSYSTAGHTKANCFSLSGNLLHTGASSVQVTVLWWHSQVFASWPDRPLLGFLDDWGLFFELTVWWIQLNSCSISCMICTRNPPFEQPAQHWQLRCQEGLCFSPNHFWSSSNLFVSCQYFLSWSIMAADLLYPWLQKPGGKPQVFPRVFCQRLQIGPFFPDAV